MAQEKSRINKRNLGNDLIQIKNLKKVSDRMLAVHV